jgi:DNA-binding transcriptional ArsR family regulator
MSTTINRDEADQLAADLGVLAEPHRLLVLGELRAGPRSAGSLARATGMAPSLASHHLAVLLRAGLVSRWREGSFVYYTLSRDRMGAVQQALARLAKPVAGARANRAKAASANGEPG